MRFSTISRRYAFCGHGCGKDSFSIALTAVMCSTRIGSTTNAVATFTVAKSVPPHFGVLSDLGDVDGVECGGVARIALVGLAPAQFREKTRPPGTGCNRLQLGGRIGAE